jgi:hypothetical protein
VSVNDALRAAMSSPRIVYRTHRNVTPESEATALEAIYRRAIERYDTRKKGSRPAAPERPERIKDDPASARSIPE